MKQALVIGFGVSGKSAKALLEHEGYRVSVYDDRTHREKIDLSLCDLVVLSPGVARSHPLCAEALERGKEVISEVELAVRNRENRMIGITGTNGKTTLTLFLQHLFQREGISAVALGNVGDPISSYFLDPKEEDLLIVELSSFQLETMHTPVFDIGMILNITPDHLDRYESLEEYAEAKARLQSCVKEKGFFYVHDSIDFPHLFDRERTIIFSSGENSDLLSAAVEIGKHYAIGKEAISEAFATFQRPEHRLQFVDTIEGVDYYNDSKATNIASVKYAIKNISQPIILIAGGFDKKLSFKSLDCAAMEKVRFIFAIGESAARISRELGNKFEVIIADNIPLAVKLAKKRANSGDSVLLSPGCSSFDQFENYMHRGKVFEECVHCLHKEKVK